MASPPNQDAIKAYYAGDYYFFNRDIDFEFSRNHQLYKRTVRLIEDQVPVKRVLEIGCSKGFLLAILSKIGWQVEGVEISSEASSFARSTFNLPVFTGEIEKYEELYPALKYPLILALDVMEHVPDPFAFIKAISRLLTKDGLLIIDTPNGKSDAINSKRGLWKGFNPFHIHVFSKDGIQLLLSKNELTIHSIYEYSYDPFASERGNLELQIRSLFKIVLQKIGLFSPVYKYYKQMTLRKEPIKDPLLRIVNLIESERAFPPVFPSECLREHGDNMVVICKKE